MHDHGRPDFAVDQQVLFISAHTCPQVKWMSCSTLVTPSLPRREPRPASLPSAHRCCTNENPATGAVSGGPYTCRAARERGGPLPSIEVADTLLDERSELSERVRLIRTPPGCSGAAPRSQHRTVRGDQRAKCLRPARGPKLRACVTSRPSTPNFAPDGDSPHGPRGGGTAAVDRSDRRAAGTQRALTGRRKPQHRDATSISLK
jgi:hypothetical protein